MIVFFSKLKKRVCLRLKGLWRFIPVGHVSLFGMGRVCSRKQFQSRLEYEIGLLKPALLTQMAEEDKAEVIRLAEKTIAHQFDYLGSGWISFEKIPWHEDIKTGFCWENDFYLNIRKKTKKGSDIKLPWELSRCHHLLWLGEAYLLTSEEKYAQEIVDEINDWIDNNPLMYSVNWTCSMDVAIRAVNWMYALNMISSSSVMTDCFVEVVYKSLFQHGFFIWHNLEKSGKWSNNHYTSDLVGLAFIGTFFSHTRIGVKWQRFAIKELFEETRKQILPSGVHYEKSISYHRLMVELTSYTLSMLTRIGEAIPDDIIRKTQSMYDFVGSYLKPNGMAPLLADNDNGRFLPFTFGDFRKHEYLLNPEGLDNRIVNCGIGQLFNYKKTNTSSIYKDAGIVIFKNKEVYLLVNNSGYSKHVESTQKTVGTHTHNDQLSFEFSVGENDIFVDPGSFVYTSSIKDRNEFRSTKKHNTLVVDDEEQNVLSDINAFTMTINNKNRNIQLNGDECCGCYETIQGNMAHERRFKVSDGSLVITDRMNKTGDSHVGCLFLHFASGLLPQMKKNTICHIDNSAIIVDIRWETEHIEGEFKADVFEDTYSPSYGVVVPSKSLAAKFSFNEECTIRTIIEWKKK